MVIVVVIITLSNQVASIHVIIAWLALRAESLMIFIQVINELLIEILGQDDECVFAVFGFNKLFNNRFDIGMPSAEAFGRTIG